MRFSWDGVFERARPEPFYRFFSSFFLLAMLCLSVWYPLIRGTGFWLSFGWTCTLSSCWSFRDSVVWAAWSKGLVLGWVLILVDRSILRNERSFAFFHSYFWLAKLLTEWCYYQIRATLSRHGVFLEVQLSKCTVFIKNSEAIWGLGKVGLSSPAEPLLSCRIIISVSNIIELVIECWLYRGSPARSYKSVQYLIFISCR